MSEEPRNVPEWNPPPYGGGLDNVGGISHRHLLVDGWGLAEFHRTLSDLIRMFIPGSPESPGSVGSSNSSSPTLALLCVRPKAGRGPGGPGRGYRSPETRSRGTKGVYKLLGPRERV